MQTRLSKRNGFHTSFYAEIILRILEYFVKERPTGHRLNTNKVPDRLSEATGVGNSVLARIKHEKNAEKRKHEDVEKLLCWGPFEIPESYVSVGAMFIRNTFIQQIKLPKIDTIYEKLIKLKDADVELLNLFDIERCHHIKKQFGNGTGIHYIDLCQD